MTIKGILPKEQFDKLGKLVFFREERIIVEEIRTWSLKSRNLIKINFYVNSIIVFIIFVSLVLINTPISLDINYATWIFLGFILFATFNLFFIYLKEVHSVNNYHRIIRDLYDNLLKFIFDYYRLSLAEFLPNFPDTKEISEDLGRAGLSSCNYYDTLSEILGIISGCLLILVLFILNNHPTYAISVLITLTILIFYAVFLYLGKKYSQAQQVYRNEADNFDLAFNDSQPLLVKTQINYENSVYKKYLKRVVSYTDRINIISELNSGLLPAFLLFLPMVFNVSNPAVVYLLVGLFVSGKLFGKSLIISHKADIDLAEKRIKDVDHLLNLIIRTNSEITPLRYKKMRALAKRYLNKTSQQENGLTIKNLEYVSGRTGQKNLIKANKLFIPAGKVSFLIGESGIGKSIFGRIVTLRYADFKAEYLGINDFDLRMFPSLEKAHENLHFSGLRNITTSYRNAVSVYIKNCPQRCLLIKNTNSFRISTDELLEFFYLNSEYYKDTLLEFLKSNRKLLSKAKRKSELRKRDPKIYYEYLGLMFKNINIKGVFLQLTKQFLEKFGIDEQREIIDDLLKIEIFSFKHLLSYIPEASLYFMDAVLSEPPISQGQRRRVLYAIDVLLEGKVFVVDEPFSNLDEHTSLNIFRDLARYAREYNSVVFILDQKMFKSIYTKHKNDFGLVMSFSKSADGNYLIEPTQNMQFVN
ncbi:hypothetical protein A3B51_01435 [Candidatus Curtissbacteria bacterium RIFCSPLOWO2_01_FULL_41_18]|uniref:ABC transporter domain-containing protein n=1 Tax=Candidatus Curtissbacteria bacterium RIFCSPLOWO2_01_FULL_41_18 TaxID=1797727 RepID=A0A1F5HIA4_9BACT|nr:MAG: hypothetical protein A3B51_01435 [Candidatus Curtissbacteria bacterium RIFCSPLOWO2_01_FULL_41_18]